MNEFFFESGVRQISDVFDKIFDLSGEKKEKENPQDGKEKKKKKSKRRNEESMCSTKTLSNMKVLLDGSYDPDFAEPPDAGGWMDKQPTNSFVKGLYKEVCLRVTESWLTYCV